MDTFAREFVKQRGIEPQVQTVFHHQGTLRYTGKLPGEQVKVDFLPQLLTQSAIEWCDGTTHRER